MLIVVRNTDKVVLLSGDNLTDAELTAQSTDWCSDYAIDYTGVYDSPIGQTTSIDLQSSVSPAIFTRSGNARSPITGATVATNVPRYEPTGTLLERGTLNTLKWTEDFSNAAWTTTTFSGTGTAPIKTPNYELAPDGTMTACRVQASRGVNNGGGDYSVVRQGAFAGTRTIWVKSNTGVNQNIAICPAAGTSITVTPVWTKYEVYHNLSVYFDIGSVGTVNSANDIDVSVWHPQMESRTYATAYVASTGSYGYRADRYSDVALLVEEATTNLCTQSVDLASYFTIRGTATKAGGQPDPWGGLTATLFSGIGTLGTNDAYRVLAGFTPSTRYEPSFYIRKVTTTGTLTFYNPNGSSGTWNISLALLGNDWERITRYHPAVTVVVEFIGSASGGSGFHFTGTTGAPLSFHACGLQLEAKTYSTSYAPTTTVAVTRNAEILTLPTAGNLSASAGTIEGWFKLSKAVGPGVLFSTLTSNPSTSTVLQVTYYNTGNLVLSVGTGATYRNSANIPCSEGNHHIAVTWDTPTNTVILWIDGVAVATDSGGFSITLGTQFGIGCQSPIGNYNINSTLNKLRSYTRALSANEIKASYGTLSPMTIDVYTRTFTETLPTGYLPNSWTYTNGVWAQLDTAAIAKEIARSKGTMIFLVSQVATVTGALTDGITQQSFDITWDKVPTATSYEVRYKTASGSYSYVTVVDSGFPTTTTRIVGLLVAEEYRLNIRATTQWGILDWSNEVIKIPTVIRPYPVTSLTQKVIDNIVELNWTPSVYPSSFPIDYYKLWRGTTFVGAEMLGKKYVTFDLLSESLAGSYKYWITVVDVNGLESTEVGVYATVNQPPDYVLVSAQTLDLNACTLTNAVVENAQIVLPVNLTITVDNHFISNPDTTLEPWTNPSDQIDDGYPVFIQPGPASAVIEKIIDYGALIPSANITMDVTRTTVAGNVTFTPELSISTDNVSFTGATNVYVASKSNFRYVKYKLTATTSDGGVGAVQQISTKLDVKQKTAVTNTINVVDTVSDGTSITFASLGITPVDVIGIVADAPYTGNATNDPIKALINFVDVANPTAFKVLAWNKSGTRIAVNGVTVTIRYT